MQFVSLKFLCFLFAVIAVNFILPKKIRYIWLLAASFTFYFMASDKLLILLVTVTLITYLSGRLIEKYKGEKKAKTVLVCTIVLLVGILGYFKYTGFLLDTVKSIQGLLKLPESELVLEILLPVGISFYLFQAIGYLADVYMGRIEAEKNYLMLALFISFFPQITSGPIERAGNMLPQYKAPASFSYDAMRDGLLLMMWGYFQKMILADRLSVLVNTVYASPKSFGGTTVFLATVFYTFEIYCDFAGYSNIAVGSARIMGIKLINNFEHPYLTGSIAEFWRKWHISLSTWLKDYIYIPLGGNRKGFTRKLINIMIVFAVSGLWHGAAWTFVVWGLLHGLYQVIGILLKPVRDKVVEVLHVDREGFSHRLFKIVVTFLLVNLGWVFFRADTFAKAMLVIKKSFSPTPWVLVDGTLFNLGLSEPDVRLLFMGLILLIVVDICNAKNIVVRNVLTKQSLPLRWFVYICAVVFIVTCGIWGPGYDAASFIYSSF